MTEKEQAAIMIDIYTDLQRIQKAEDRDKELNNQLQQGKGKIGGPWGCGGKPNH